MEPSARPEARPRGILWVMGAAVLWSSGGLFIKIAPASGLGVAFARAAVTSAFYVLVLRPDLRRARWSTALAYAGMIATFVTATKLTTAANAVFLQYTGPAYVLVLAPRLLGERFARIDAVCVALCILGMSLFFLDGLGTSKPGQTTGNLIGAASGVCFALAVIGMRRDALSEGGDPLPSVTLGNLIATVGIFPIVWREVPGMLTPAAAGIFLYLGVVQMGLAYLAFGRGLKRTPAATASLVSMLEPVLNPLWVFLGTRERPGFWSMIGGGVVVSAVAARTWWSGRREPDAKATPPPSEPRLAA